MKKILLILTLLCCSTPFIVAQEQQKKHYSHEEYCKQQQEFITKYAKLTAEEAKQFFPLFFEFQKNKWEINKEARKRTKKDNEQEPTAEEYIKLVNKIADAKIKIAQLEKSYIEKYMKIISARKILDVQRAEDRFQREMIKKMARGQRKKENN
jgi:hypothetical protein